MRCERYHSRPVSPAGSRAARASRRPGRLHQPPAEDSGDRKPSQEWRPAQARVPAHCQAVRSRATSQTAATSSTVRVRAASRTSSPYRRTVRVLPRAVGRIQWARLTTMKGSSTSHRARLPLPEVRLHQTYASGTGPPRWAPGLDSASASPARRKTAAVSSPVIRTVRGSPSIFPGVAPPTPWTSSSRAAPVSPGGSAWSPGPVGPCSRARSTVRTSPVTLRRHLPRGHKDLHRGGGTHLPSRNLPDPCDTRAEDDA